MSDSIKITDSDYESSRRSSPRPFDSHNCHYQTALFRGGSHWSAASACGDNKQQYDQKLDHTIIATPLDDGDRENNEPEESNTLIEAEVISVKVVKVYTRVRSPGIPRQIPRGKIKIIVYLSIVCLP